MLLLEMCLTDFLTSNIRSIVATMLMNTMKENNRGKKCRSLILQFNVHNCALASVEKFLLLCEIFV